MSESSQDKVSKILEQQKQKNLQLEQNLQNLMNKRLDDAFVDFNSALNNIMSRIELGQQVDQQLTEPGYTSDRRPSDIRQPEPSAVSQSVGANSADAEQNNRSNPANQSEIRNITVSDFRESAPKPKAFQGIRQQLGRTSQDPHEAERDGVSGLLPSPSAKTSEPESQGNDDWDDYLRFSLDSNASNVGDDLLLKTLDEPTATAIGSGGTIDRTTTAAVGADFSENSADTGRGSSINDGDRVTQRPRSQANADYSQNQQQVKFGLNPKRQLVLQIAPDAPN